MGALILITWLVGTVLGISFVYNKVQKFIYRNALESPTRFLFEDGNYYWFTVREYTDSLNKIRVYSKNPLERNKLGLLYGDVYTIGEAFSDYECVDINYNQSEVESKIKKILRRRINKIESMKKKSRLKEFKGYVGDLTPEQIKSIEREDKINQVIK